MTIPVADNKITQECDGAKDFFQFSFKYLNNSDIKVYVIDADGVLSLQIEGVDYTLSSTDKNTGGTVTFGSAPAADKQVLIIREMTIDQGNQFKPNTNFPEAVVEASLDKLTMISQQFNEVLSRVLQLPLNSPLDAINIPNPDPLKLWRWNLNGTNVEYVDYESNHSHGFYAGLESAPPTPYDFGAEGNDSHDDTQAFLDWWTYLTNNGYKSAYCPDGQFLIGEAFPTNSLDFVGQSVSGTILKPVFDSAAYLFNLDRAAGEVFARFANFSVIGSDPVGYANNEKLMTATNAYNTIFENIVFRGMNGGFNLTNAWGVRMRNIRGMYNSSPVYMTKANGALMDGLYFQRFDGTAIQVVTGLSVNVRNLIVEHGADTDTIALYLQACHSAHLDGLYTEGDMGKDIYLGIKNSRANLNCLLENMWLNSNASKMIHAYVQSGLKVRNVVMQTPQATELIYNESGNLIRVANVCQVDQNANNFIADRRGAGQTLIPISNRNDLIVMDEANQNVGNGTDADLTNIANHTVINAGYRPLIRSGYGSNKANALTGFDRTAVGSFQAIAYGGTGINLYSDRYGSVQIRVTGTVTSSSGAAPYFHIGLNNDTFSEAGPVSLQNVVASGDSWTGTLSVPVRPGNNLIKLGIDRYQGGSGTNTFACTDYVIY